MQRGLALSDVLPHKTSVADIPWFWMPRSEIDSINISLMNVVLRNIKFKK